VKKIIAAALVAGLGFGQAARAQVVLDMSQITCKQLGEMDDRAPMIEAWLAGYFGATQDRSTVDLRYLERNIKVASEYCKSHPSETLMKVVEKTAK
jgi:acid stress chaperone HdeB